MKVLAFTALMFCLVGCLSPGDLGTQLDKYVQTTQELVGSVKAGVDQSLAAVEATRAVAGKPKEDALDWKEWLIIAGGILSSALGVNTIRNQKYLPGKGAGTGGGATS